MTPELGYGCDTCGPFEYCPDDAMARHWEDYDPRDEPESVAVPVVVAEYDERPF
jgi:hypothetical protein